MDQQASDVVFRHSGWHPSRRLVAAALHDLRINDNRLEAFCTCGSNAWVLENPQRPGDLAIVGSYCHDRFCVPCAQSRAALITHNLAEHLTQKNYRFITLTLRSDQEPLTELLDHLYTSFRKLRRRKLWQACIVGGAAFLEVKWNAETSRWHPHLHIICEGTYIPQKLLSADWLAVTGTSFIVDVRFIRDQTQVLRYVTKYASKPLSSTFLRRQDRLQEAIVAMGGRHLCTTFGTWRKWRLLDVPDPRHWNVLGTLNDIISGANHGNPQHAQILDSLKNSRPWNIDTPEEKPP